MPAHKLVRLGRGCADLHGTSVMKVGVGNVVLFHHDGRALLFAEGVLQPGTGLVCIQGRAIPIR